MDARSYQKILATLRFEKNETALYKHILFDICLLGAAFGLTWGGIAGQVGAALLLSVFMFRSFSMMHEAVHAVAHSSRIVNKWCGHLYGACSFLPFSQWREIHLQHHIWAGNLAMDPTMKIIKNFKDTGASPTSFQEFAWRWWLPYLAFRQQLVFWRKSCSELGQGKWREDLIVLAELAACAGFVVLCAWAFGPLAIGLAVIGYLVLVELINFPHHTGLAQDLDGARLSPRDQYRIARSVIYARWFCRYVLLNFNYHTEHHLFPALPWHQLELAHARLREELNIGFNLCYGNAWLIASRRMTFREILIQSTRKSEEELEKPKLVL